MNEATAFVPGHLSGFSGVHRADDPTAAGARGGGIVVSEGVRVTVRPTGGDELVVELNGEPVELEAVSRVLGALRVPGARVEAETHLVPGAGFGLTGAVALGAALAANAVLDRVLSEDELLTVAHGAEVQAGTGLGDVVAGARGGVPLRLEPGGPAHNRTDGIPARGRVEYLTLDGLLEIDAELPPPEASDLRSGAAGRALSAVVSEPTLPVFMRASRRFAREADLLTDELRETVEAVSRAGGEAAVAAGGPTVFALDSGLSDAGYDPEITEIDPAGARMVPRNGD
ncbi:pantoate kinase [Salinirubellus sp. GCM10025818]|uniref:pantoate kinase n=1 Tax=Salinirubellus TaxID=2162630 RepID=UPI0030D588BA